MVLPDTLQSALEEILRETELKDLRKGSSQLSSHYREQKSLQDDDEKIAYLAARLPATFHALLRVLKELPFRPISILDIGAGPGTLGWVAKELWGDLPITAIEKDPFFISLAKRIGTRARFVEKDVKKMDIFETYDLVCFSYSFGEILDRNVLLNGWQSAKKALLILEPGTPKGSQNVILARELLIKEGGRVLAPCPHSHACPLSSPSWCHFSTRVERNFFHRKAKEATLSFEDEKYSYVIVSKEPISHANERLIEDPLKKSGHIYLKLCSLNGLKNKIVTRKEKELYKKARKSKWGDLF